MQYINKLVSVIIPVYNDELYLKECLDSVVNQTYKKLEIIIVNDGSTDTSLDICKQYADRDTRIKVIDKKNGGPSSARNKGINCANGDYIGFVDGDDVIASDMYEKLLAACERNSANCSICNINVFEKRINITNNRRFICSDYTTEDICKIFKYSLNESQSLCNKLFNRKLFRKIRLPLNRLSEDGYICYDLLYKAKRVSYCSTTSYFYRKRCDSITTQKFRKNDCDLVVSNVRTYYRVCKMIPSLWEDGVNRVINKGFSNVMEKISRLSIGDFFKEYDSMRCIKRALAYVEKDIFRAESINKDMKKMVSLFMISPFFAYLYSKMVF